MPQQDTADRLSHFAQNIQRWRDEAARLTLVAARSRHVPPTEDELVELEKTANDIYDDIAGFQKAVDEVSSRSLAAAAELQVVSDALRLVLLEITELGVRLYSVHSGIPHSTPS